MRINLNEIPLNSNISQRGPKWVVTAIALIGLIVGSLIVRSLIILAPFIRTGLNIPESRYGYLNSALMLGTLIMTLPVGTLVSRFSTRRAYGTILAVVGVSLILLSKQNNFYGMIGVLFCTGITAAGIIPLANRVIVENFDQNKRGTITGFVFAAVPLGGLLGAAVFPVMGEKFGWWSGFQLLGAVSLMGSVLSWTMLSDAPPAQAASTKKIQFKYFGSKTFIFLAGIYGLFAFCMTSEIYYTTLYLVDVVRVSSVLAGTLFGLIQMAAIGGRLFWGVLADKYFSKNRFWLLCFTSSIMFMGTLTLILLNPASPIWLIVINLLIFGLGGASSWAILSTLVGDVVEVSFVATATAAVLFITNLTDIIGPMFFGNLIDITGSYKTSFAIFMGLNGIVIAGFLTLAINKHRQLSKLSA